MAKKNSQITLRVAAVDATARVFKRVASSAMSVTKSIAKWGSVAAVAAGGAFALAARQLGKLSDVAQSAGASTGELTKLSGALDALGIKASSPEELALAFQRMTKATGEVGVEGFHRVIGEIAQLPTIEERAAAAMKVFGKTGLNFLPVVEAAAQGGVKALKDVEAGMPGISQAAADAGDAAADAMGIVGNGVKEIWFDAIGAIARALDGEFTGGVREAAMVASAHMEYFAKASWAYIKPFITNTKAVFLQLSEWIARVMHNGLVIIGGILVTTAKNFALRVKNIYLDAVDGVEMLIAKMTGNDDVYNMVVERMSKRRKDIDKKTAYNWEEMFGVFRTQLKWGLADGPLSNVDLEDLKKARDAQIKNAKKAGEAYSKAAVGLGAKVPGLGGGAQQEQKTNPEAMLGNSYKAITYAMRAGYATVSDKIIGGIKRAGDFLQKIERNTSDMASLGDFKTVG